MTFLDGHDALGKDFENEIQGLEGIEEVGALNVLKRGLKASPELKAGISLTALMALAVAGGKLLVPLTIKEVLDRGITSSGVNVNSVLFFSLIAMFLSIAGMALGKATYYRLAKTAENVLMGLRIRTFEHLHKLSIADHVQARKGAYTARVTSDVETLTQFAQWGAIAWIINSIQILAVLVIMVVYSWHLSIVTLLVHAPLFPVLKWMQRRQLRAHDRVRSRVSDTLSVVSESIQGVDVVRAYGYRRKTRSKLHHAIDDQYKEQMVAQKYFSFVLPITDIIGVAAIAAVVGAGVYWGPDWGVTSGELIAFVFLSNLLVMPISELGEVLNQTQTALAGWWKVLEVLDKEIEVKEPHQGLTLPNSPLDVKVEELDFSYRTGGVVLDNVDIYIPAGISVAVVGETGSGKTTFAKLLTRLADPTSGRILVNGQDLKEIDSDHRHRTIRMVPQDGFLFDTSVIENVRFGRNDAQRSEAEEAIDDLGLWPWIEQLPEGLETRVGERGESLSVGERQLVALARAQVADPGLLILDEATSAIDPETEQMLEVTLERLAQGRTTVSVAHRISTAERADLILVFDKGKIVEKGEHSDLVNLEGIYSKLYESWIGNTREV
ncbi:MAG: ABC transporter ATP-binding protein [Acidimicrobiales bacterium]|jgi:putative ABC transport system ATP-binding protein|nr:multidrug ABC transporter ATP-binding protein [Acidimicrobiaceae bacterium]MDP6161141.1 ABC transporter ATP-binding protein [Acidimicrobiales bacterium]HJL90800.1 ABC transporter ATP-binding protein [Acidimicrobiales bacterium]HJO40875.1 ABC transporter ATP-binding protein [Acidimicrobiales bacterium]